MTNGDNTSELPESWSREHPHAAEILAVEVAIQDHPGQKLALRLRDLERIFTAWAGFSVGLGRLLEKCETHEPTITELVIRNVGDTSQRAAITTALDQATVAYVAGLGALIDHTRIVLKSQADEIQTEHADLLRSMTATVPAALFLAKLRTYVLHYVVAPWEFTAEQNGDTITAKVLLATDELLKIEWQAPVRSFIKLSGSQIHLSPLLNPYLNAMHSLTTSFIERCWQANARLFDEVDALVAKRNLLLSGGVTDGRDWAARVANMEENIKRAERGEMQVNFQTGRPFQMDPELEGHAP
ncbi:hypothetical protein [Salinibacterium sp. ZJ450]|uniref:hypothetical protein n=1 Tax=Salinibacterium sp. ZJ450 TaxID=2708338 RepID=UPI00141DCDED|nr:hypothetical protein [Salinibacterium sp. ZJ450]